MQKDDRIFAMVGAGVVGAVAVAAISMWLASGITVEAPQRARVEVPRLAPPTVTVTEVAAPNVVEASFDAYDEDGPVRAAVARLSSHPEFAAYLVNDRLLRRFVLAVDAIAGGYSPRDQLGFLRPERAFLVREQDGRLLIAAGSYRRYRLVADVFASFDTDTAVELYRRFRPELEAIYREVAWASDDFDIRLRDAIDHLLEVSVPAEPIEVEQRAIVYAYADDGFENLSEAQKLLVRMGSRNAGAVQSKLREIREAMGWPEREPILMTAGLDESEMPGVDALPVGADTSPSISDDPVESRAEVAAAP